MLKTNKIIREKLFLNQYKYRVKIRIDALRFFYPYLLRVHEYGSHKADHHYSEFLSPAEIKTISNLVGFKNKYSSILGTKIRKDYGCFTVFTQNKDVVDEVIELVENPNNLTDNKATIEVTEIIDLVPEGIKYFKRTPDAKKRVYLKEQYVSGLELANELNDFFDRSPSLKPSKSLKSDISEQRWKRTWIQRHHYFDCNSDADISYFVLVFPELVNKIYKLEKKPKDAMIE